MKDTEYGAVSQEENRKTSEEVRGVVKEDSVTEAHARYMARWRQMICCD